MIPALVLRPVLDVVAPEDPAAPARRVRNTAVWMAISAWLLPPHAGLGTETVAGRGSICAAFVAAAVVAHLARRAGWPRRALAAVVAVAAAAVTWWGRGSWWGIGFALFCALVFSLTAARRRWVRLADPGHDPDPPSPSGLAKWLHLYAWIGISVLVLREWAGQTMVVPTGSMQPTIMGARANASGDYLFVDNFSYLFREPSRWEIVVFEYPLYRPRYFVKRLVGLPGEKIEFRDGDVWADGRIARKPPVVQETLWRETFPRARPGARRKAINDGFQQDLGTPGTWQRVSESEARCKPAAGAASFAKFTSSEPNGDVRLEFTAEVAPGATAIGRLSKREVPVTLEVDGSGRASLFVGERRVELPAVALRGGRLRAELCVADGETWAVLDGRPTQRTELVAPSRGRNRIEIGARGGVVSFKDVRVSRDIVYSDPAGASWEVPRDGYFFVGDNVEHSTDSRRWRVDVFHPPGGAPPVAAAQSLVSETGSPDVVNIRGDAASWRFLDVDGVARELPREGTRREPGVPAPFARRSHLVGRAIMIFWPWAIGEAGFRPRLLP